MNTIMIQMVMILLKKNNNLIHHKDSDGYEFWKEYDENNNLIHSKDSDGCEKWYGPNGDEINPIETKSVKYELTEEEYKEYIILKTYFEKLQKAVNDITKELYSDIQ